ncbi:4-hydroxyphenylacetate 3-hydroxylase N-terminal domain-containing protein [Spongiactinospora sp. TRM90649]|uniref:4-hydroxyphenylacetate 3-hydroxylase family protein n=1 Tax=Spongiactinospora sp. TRM90649 TaxID=3031114 RepID=UPI0023F65165|nr:4-hydroxyphenylacetate 3-hydroxylase N-terminal domain-containing protein [Spongiactinospora sp. TRM90649]MDF5756944.1 4-hydroxyphenylacetate 3-hydroxylase N-terminal domain-containing protein [Spongiactinospora sp. TRM90649]
MSMQGALTGERYRELLRDGREVWLNGKRIDDVTEHPAFRGTVDRFAELYDAQHNDVMTFESPETGNRVSKSYLLPRTFDQLKEKYANTQAWMRNSWGQLGRSPDYMANVTVGLYDMRDDLNASRAGFGDNAVAYHRYCMENDLAITHAIGDPQIDRSKTPLDDPDMALRIIEEREDGVVVRGAKQLATLAPFAHEVLCYLSASFARRGAPEFVIWFALPMNAPGLKILCREPLGDHAHGHSHPFARLYDEQDAMLFFDDVVIPWDRVFLLHDGELAMRGLGRITPWASYSSHVRFQERMKTALGVATRCAEAIGVAGFRNVQEQLGEMTAIVELSRLLTVATEAQHKTSPGGLVQPVGSQAIGYFSATNSGKMADILRKITASGLLMQPSEADLDNAELRPLLDRYMRGKDIGAPEKARLFRLAWDLVGGGFGQRQELYEYLHRGDPARNLINLHNRYDRTEIDERINRLISEPLTP